MSLSFGKLVDCTSVLFNLSTSLKRGGKCANAARTGAFGLRTKAALRAIVGDICAESPRWH